MNIVLIRHTRPDVPHGTCYGKTDVNLPRTCANDFALVAARLAALNLRPQRVFCSPLTRCTKLAHHLFPSLDLTFDDRLQEMHFGQWENTLWANIARADIDRWADAVTDFAPPNGESYSQLYRRCRDFAHDALVQRLGAQSMGTARQGLDGPPDGPDQTVCIVTHAGVIRSLLAFFLQNRRIENNRSASEIPRARLTHLLEEPIDFGAVCHIVVDDTAPEVRYSIS